MSLGDGVMTTEEWTFNGFYLVSSEGRIIGPRHPEFMNMKNLILNEKGTDIMENKIEVDYAKLIAYHTLAICNICGLYDLDRLQVLNDVAYELLRTSKETE